MTWTFSDPSGWESLRLEKPSGLEPGCRLPPIYAERFGGKPGFDLLPVPGTAGVNLESPASEVFPEHKMIPMFFEVSGRHGVIAQGPLTFEPGIQPRTRHGGWPSP
jgi:hypothetical protein